MTKREWLYLKSWVAYWASILAICVVNSSTSRRGFCVFAVFCLWVHYSNSPKNGKQG